MTYAYGVCDWIGESLSIDLQPASSSLCGVLILWRSVDDSQAIGFVHRAYIEAVITIGRLMPGKII